MNLEEELKQLKNMVEQLQGWNQDDFIWLGVLGCATLFLWLASIFYKQRIISEVASQIEHSFWTRKRIEDTRREKIEQLMLELDKDMELAKQQNIHFEDTGQVYAISSLVNLYFENLSESKDNYLKARRLNKVEVSNCLSLKKSLYVIPEALKFVQNKTYIDLQKEYQKFVDVISIESNKMNQIPSIKQNEKQR